MKRLNKIKEVKVPKNIKQMLNEFKSFLMKGDVISLATGIIIGGSFGKIVSSLVADVLMPLIGLVLGKISFTNLYFVLDFKSYDSLEAAKKAGAPLLMYGNFIQTLVDFTIVGFSIFMVLKAVAKAQDLASKKEEAAKVIVEPTTKECHACASDIKIKAKICPHCRSEQA